MQIYFKKIWKYALHLFPIQLSDACNNLFYEASGKDFTRHSIYMTNRNYFISYHHASDFPYLVELRERMKDKDWSDYGFKDENLKEASQRFISRKIQYRVWTSSIIIVLVGSQTGRSAWVDWEIWYSLRHLKRSDYPNIRTNPKGMIALFLPTKTHSVPKRLDWNLRSGYAVRLDWEEIDNSFQRTIDLANKNRKYKHRVRNPYTLDLILQRIRAIN